MFDLTKSPIRRNIQSLQEGALSIFEDSDLEHAEDEKRRKLQVRTILKDVENMLGTMESGRLDPIKIAVMGEVKAGKSTFINVCVGKEIAYTDILEATAVVSEIKYADEEYAKVYNQAGEVVKECSFEQLLEWTESMLEEGEDFSLFSKIEIGVNNELLPNLVLVDTPGLLSITSENHDITNQYIAQTDYILWVIDSRNLGSKAVNDFIRKVKLSGKPIFGIINKVDSEKELLEIKDYVMKEYNNYFEEMFFVSSSYAWESLRAGEADWEQTSGFDAILDCIEDLAEDKEYSNDRTQYYQLQREREVHMIFQSRIAARKKYYDNELAAFARINTEMKKVIWAELQNWYARELYMEEKTNLMNADGEEFKNLFKQYSDAGYLTDVVERKYNEMACFIYKKWDIIEKWLMNHSSQILIDFSYDKDIDDDIANATGNGNTEEASATGAKEGMKKGAILGMAFAGYAAWLGPAAATITFAEVLIPWVLPLALGGAFVGSIFGSAKFDVASVENNAKKKKELIEDFYQEILKAASKEIKNIRMSLEGCTEHYYEERCERYREKARQLNFDFTEPAYSAFMQELENYISELDAAIAECAGSAVPVPPSMEGLNQ